VQRLALALVLVVGCQSNGGGTGGLVVVSDTAMVGPPPECADGASSETGETGEAGGSESTDGLEERAGDPGTAFCAQFASSAACDHTPRMDGDAVVGECHWVTVVPVLPGTCEATTLYETCVHVPVTGEACAAAQSCGQVGLGVFGRAGCDGTVEVLVNPPGQAFCAPPSDWPLCWPDDSAPECSCVCS
jgi:hypothetical protein